MLASGSDDQVQLNAETGTRTRERKQGRTREAARAKLRLPARGEARPEETSVGRTRVSFTELRLRGSSLGLAFLFPSNVLKPRTFWKRGKMAKCYREHISTCKQKQISQLKGACAAVTKQGFCGLAPILHEVKRCPAVHGLQATGRRWFSVQTHTQT